MLVARRPTRVWFSDSLLERLDRHRAREGRSRSEVVRDAVALHLEADIDRQLVEAYSREPLRDIWGEAAARQIVEQEPW